MAWKTLISLLLRQSESLNHNKKYNLSYSTSCALTLYLIIKEFFVCCCDTLRISFLGENQLLKTTCFANFFQEINLLLDLLLLELLKLFY